MRRLILAIGALGALLALLSGCGLKGTLKPNLAPVATVFVRGPVDTVSHNVHLYWFGTDADGYVVGYEIRFLNPGAPADTEWVATTETDSVFSIYTPEGYAAPAFEVRAIDNEGLKSAIARQDFQFSNTAPTVAFTNRFSPSTVRPDTTYPAVTLTWSAADPDGDGTKLRYRIWLNGNEANADLVSGTSYSIPSERFKVGGVWPDGATRTVFIEAIDDGGMVSATDQMSWFVRGPGSGGHYPHQGRLLIIDDMNSGNASVNGTTDSIYVNTAARNLGAGEYSILRMEFTQPFRSGKDLEQTCKLFDAVVWYIGNNSRPTAGGAPFARFDSTLYAYQSGLAAYLEAGGNVYLDGTDLIYGNYYSRGPLDADWISDYLGSDFLFMQPYGTTGDSTAGWSHATPAGYFVDQWGDTLRVANLTSNSFSYGPFRVFGVQDDAFGLVWTATPPYTSIANPGYLPLPVPVAVSVPQPSGGRLVVVTFPLRAASTPTVGSNYWRVHTFLAHVFQQMGLTGS
jgi:hypothetical protein